MHDRLEIVDSALPSALSVLDDKLTVIEHFT